MKMERAGLLTSGSSWMQMLFLLVALGVACKHEPLAGPEPIGSDSIGGQESGPVDTCDAGTAYFQQEVLPIFVQYCTMSGCHNTPNNNNDEIALTSWEAVMGSDVVGNGDLWEALNEAMSDDDHMPPDSMNQLSTDQLLIIQDWLEQGAQNNSCESGCDMASVTYSGTVQPLVQNRCLGCHSGANPQGELNFSSWSVLNTVASDGRLAGAIQHQSGYTAMPPNGPMLPQCHIGQVLTWIQDGAPNN